VAILRCLLNTTAINSFPQPHVSLITLSVGNASHRFSRDDFHVSFTIFLQDVPAQLQESRSAVETNRCFFLHLGVAMNIHPFALQTFFRWQSSLIIKGATQFEPCVEVLNTMQEYAGFVDAYSLCFIWPEEVTFSFIPLI
jgi:hypothetical protein